MNRKGFGQLKQESSDGRLAGRESPFPAFFAGSAGTLLILICAMDAWFFGGIPLISQAWLARATLLVACLTFAALLTSPRRRLAWPVAMWPLLAAILIGVLQVTPLPQTWLDQLSPAHRSYSRDVEVVAASSKLAPASEFGRLSLHPASTRQTVCLLVIGVSMFFLASQLLVDSFWLLFACGVFAVHGAVFSMIGVFHQFSDDGRMFWLHAPSQGGQPFASFVNRNHAGDYLNLCLAGCIGISLWLSGRSGWLFPMRSAIGKSYRASLRQFASSWNSGSLAIVVVASVLITGLIGSISRGAVLSAAIAFIVTIGFLRIRLAAWHGWLLGAGVLVVVMLSFTGSGILGARLYKLTDLRLVATEPRLLHWRDSVRAIPDFWRVGSGLGTYRYVYPSYETHSSDAWYYHAENQYLEAVVEAGVPALLLIATATAACLEASLHLAWRADDYRDLAVGATGLFAVASQAVHAAFDFGLYMPANMVLFATICGGVCGYAHLRRPSASKCGLHRLVGVPVFACVGIALLVSAHELEAAAAADSATRQAKQVANTPEVDIKIVRQATDRLKSAIKRYEDHAESHLQLANLYVLRYRKSSFEQLQNDAQLGKQARTTLWDMTSPRYLFRRVHEWSQTQQPGNIARSSSRIVASDDLSHATKHYALAQAACPSMSRPLLHLAELSAVSGSLDGSRVLLDGVRHRAPCDVGARFRCGELEYYAGRYQQAFLDWKTCLTFSTEYLEPIVELASRQLSFHQLIKQVMPDQPKVLVQLAHDFFSDAPYERQHLGELAERLLDNGNLTPADHHLRAIAFQLQSRLPEALADYHRAMVLDSRNARIRYDLAGLLEEMGDVPQARRHARICVNMEPTNQRYQDLLRQLGHQSKR